MLKQQLNDFMQEKISLSELKSIIEDRLFELRQTPTLSREQEILSNLELLIHESAEGLRSTDELYEAIRLEALPEVSNTINISIRIGTSTNIFTGASPTRDYQCSELISA
jgi:hypothetical protein